MRMSAYRASHLGKILARLPLIKIPQRGLFLLSIEPSQTLVSPMILSTSVLLVWGVTLLGLSF